MKLLVDVKRFDPKSGTPFYQQQYEVEAEPTDRLLDVLLRIKSLQDASLSFRYSCAHGVCGSDAMRINGVERLACKTILRDVAREGETVTLEPLRSMRVQRDLMVDQEDFFKKYRSVNPFLITGAAAPKREFTQLPAQRARFDDPTKCILCGACYSACPVIADKNPRFIGPAAIVQAGRFVFDSRDDGIEARLDPLDSTEGAWACENHFDCTKVCPRGIKVTKCINETKRAITAYQEKHHEAS